MENDMYELLAVHEEFENDEHHIGWYLSMEDALKKVIEIDNDEDHEYSFMNGYDMILKHKATGRQWFCADDGWDPMDN